MLKNKLAAIVVSILFLSITGICIGSIAAIVYGSEKKLFINGRKTGSLILHQIFHFRSDSPLLYSIIYPLQISFPVHVILDGL